MHNILVGASVAIYIHINIFKILFVSINWRTSGTIQAYISYTCTFKYIETI